MGLREQLGAESEVPIALLHLMRKYRVTRHTSSCEWALSPTWKDRLLNLWKGVDRKQWIRDFPFDKYPANKVIAERIDQVWKLGRDPQVYEDAMAELWEEAARDGITEEEALVRYFGGRQGMPLIDSQDPKKFLKAMEADKPMIDDVSIVGNDHGAYTHMFQEYALARKIGKGAAGEFRQAIARAVGPDVGNTKFASQLWDALFDEYQGEFINSPEGLGPIIQKILGLT